MHNFRNFRDADIAFSCDKDKNVTVILGQNTAGKTTIVKAFIWAFYRINTFENKILLNSDVADAMFPNTVKIAKVEIEIEHKNYTYKITTKEEYSKSNLGRIWISNKADTSLIKVNADGGVPLSGNKAYEEIDSILRPELKEYFFFDGETNSINEVTSKKNLTDAVSNILGLTNMMLLKDFYDPTKGESVPSYLRKKVIAIDSNAVNDYTEGLEKALKKKSELESELNENTKEIERLQNQRTKKELLIDSNKDVEADQNDKKRLMLSIEKDKNTKESDFSNLISSINASNSLLKGLFGVSYIKNNIEACINSSTFNSQDSWSHVSEEFIDQIIARGRCVCGAEIRNESEAYKHLLLEKDKMEPRDFGKYASDFSSAEQNNVYYASSIMEAFSTGAEKLINLIIKIDEDKERLSQIVKRIEGKPDIGETQKELNQIIYQLGAKESRDKNIIEADIPEAEMKIKEFNSKISSNSAKTQENEFIDKCIDYAELIYEKLKERISLSKNEIKEKLLSEVTESFNKMYHGKDRTICIDDNFKVGLLTKEKEIDLTQGLKTVMNYSFVTGLSKLAREHASDDELGDIEDEGESYPLVMDAPFSATDDLHIKNICKVLPEYCDQVIMCVMQKDFEHASKSLKEKIGKLYILKKIDETESRILEDDNYGNV